MPNDPKRRFVRVYYDDLERDYPTEVWFDPTCLSTFVRLLSLADKAWPSTPELPRSVRRADLTMLTNLGLVTLLDNYRFSVKGYAPEREERAEKARFAVGQRRDRSTSAPTTVPTSVPTNVPTNDPPSRAHAGLEPEQVLEVDVPEGASGEQDPVVVYANLAGGYPSMKAMDWIDQLSGEYGSVAVIQAFGKARGPAGKLIGAAQDILRAEARELSLREKDVERAKVAERRNDGMQKRRLEYLAETGKWPAEWGERPAA